MTAIAHADDVVASSDMGTFCEKHRIYEVSDLLSLSNVERKQVRTVYSELRSRKIKDVTVGEYAEAVGFTVEEFAEAIDQRMYSTDMSQYDELATTPDYSSGGFCCPCCFTTVRLDQFWLNRGEVCANEADYI